MQGWNAKGGRRGQTHLAVSSELASKQAACFGPEGSRGQVRCQTLRPPCLLHGTTQCGARHGETQHLLESQADLVVRHPADHLRRGEGEQPGPEIPCPRTPSKSAALATVTTLLAAMTHYELPSRVGWAECRPGTDRCSLPTYLRTGTAPGSEPRRVGNWDRRTACRPYLDPGLRASSGPVSAPWRRVRLGDASAP